MEKSILKFKWNKLEKFCDFVFWTVWTFQCSSYILTLKSPPFQDMRHSNFTTFLQFSLILKLHTKSYTYVVIHILLYFVLLLHLAFISNGNWNVNKLQGIQLTYQRVGVTATTKTIEYIDSVIMRLYIFIYIHNCAERQTHVCSWEICKRKKKQIFMVKWQLQIHFTSV